ncbi:helix-turn-helix domain-containing protein [Microbacterium sp. 22242]|uniref:helix-turn-helix domain-containing protein n=1 Tax=Microbacterium sp. 22242 TaxID=3453896 RepID=UPI003F83C13A
MGNEEIRETTLLNDALASIERLLPRSWRLESAHGTNRPDRAIDALVALIGPNKERTTFAVEAKRSGTPHNVLMAFLRDMSRQVEVPLLYVSDYIGAGLRSQLTAEGVSYADATGWVRLTSESPLVLVTGHGADRAPRTTGTSAVARLNGVAASRIIRALCTTELPLGVRALAERADVSPGSVSKLLPTLTTEGIVDRNDAGQVTAVRRRELIRRWVRDYSFTRANRPNAFFIAPRGVDRMLARLVDSEENVTMTGAAAARRLLPDGVVPVVPLRVVALYAARPAVLAEHLELIPADAVTGNVVIAAPQDAAILENDIAPDALVLADLLTLPGRGDAEAEQLMDAFARADDAWSR